MLTYRIDYNEYTGGAHGIYMSTFLNLDLKTLSPIRLDDLFEGDYKEALTDLLWKQLMADNNVSTRQELEDMGYATTGDLEPIENFYLDPTGITFYYNVYEIAPYVMGATKITLSYEDIAPLMNGKFIVLSSAIKTADSGPFIEFMLQEILNTLKRHQGSLISQHNVMEVRDKIRDKFGISSEQIIEQIQRNPAVTLDEIAAALSVTRRSIEKKIKELRDAGYIRREGSNKSGRWIVNDEV
jgi:biotin operon repressor